MDVSSFFVWYVLRTPLNHPHILIQRLGVDGGQNVEVVVHLLDINPFSNYLSINSGKENPNL